MLPRQQKEARDNGKVFTYLLLQVAGSGKNVELACSSHTREATLALLFGGIKDSHKLLVAQEQSFNLWKDDQDAQDEGMFLEIVAK